MVDKRDGGGIKKRKRKDSCKYGKERKRKNIFKGGKAFGISDVLYQKDVS